MRYFLFLVLFISLYAGGQETYIPDLSAFSETTLELAKANNAVTFMTDQEKDVVFYTNLVRMEPQVFLERIVKPYVASMGLKRSYYLKTLYTDLKKASPVSALQMKLDLYTISYKHQMDIGKKGLTGHTGSKGKTFRKRVKPLMITYSAIGENVALGYTSPIENVLELLIDDGVTNLGHRITMLSDKYNSVGVALGFHKTYKTGCVMDFGMK